MAMIRRMRFILAVVACYEKCENRQVDLDREMLVRCMSLSATVASICVVALGFLVSFLSFIDEPYPPRTTAELLLCSYTARDVMWVHEEEQSIEDSQPLWAAVRRRLRDFNRNSDGESCDREGVRSDHNAETAPLDELSSVSASAQELVKVHLFPDTSLRNLFVLILRFGVSSDDSPAYGAELSLYRRSLSDVKKKIVLQNREKMDVEGGEANERSESANSWCLCWRSSFQTVSHLLTLNRRSLDAAFAFSTVEEEDRRERVAIFRELHKSVCCQKKYSPPVFEIYDFPGSSPVTALALNRDRLFYSRRHDRYLFRFTAPLLQNNETCESERNYFHTEKEAMISGKNQEDILPTTPLLPRGGVGPAALRLDLYSDTVVILVPEDSEGAVKKVWTCSVLGNESTLGYTMSVHEMSDDDDDSSESWSASSSRKLRSHSVTVLHPAMDAGKADNVGVNMHDLIRRPQVTTAARSDTALVGFLFHVSVADMLLMGKGEGRYSNLFVDFWEFTTRFKEVALSEDGMHAVAVSTENRIFVQSRSARDLHNSNIEGVAVGDGVTSRTSMQLESSSYNEWEGAYEVSTSQLPAPLRFRSIVGVNVERVNDRLSNHEDYQCVYGPPVVFPSHTEQGGNCSTLMEGNDYLLLTVLFDDGIVGFLKVSHQAPTLVSLDFEVKLLLLQLAIYIYKGFTSRTARS